MIEVLREYLPILIAALVIGILVGFIVFRPRQRVHLSKDEAPTRPHMSAPAAKPEQRKGRGIADEAAAAASDVTGQIISAPVHANLPGAPGPPDDLQRLKGVGPKLAAMLNDLGITRFEQLARLGGADLDRIDQSLGAFRGRLKRDQVPQQADYLARGDEDGFEHRFGRL